MAPERLRYKETPFFIEDAHARLLVNQSRLYSDAFRRVLTETGREPKRWVLADIPLTREELEERKHRYNSGEYLTLRKAVSHVRTISKGIVDLYTLVGNLNSVKISGARRGLGRLEKAEKVTHAQKQLSHKKLQTNQKVKRDGERILEEIRKADYKNEKQRETDIETVEMLISGNTVAGQYLIEITNSVQLHKSAIESVKKSAIIFDGNDEYLMACEEAFRTNSAETLSGEDLANVYMRLLRQGTIQKLLAGISMTAQVERNQKKPKKNLLERIKEAFAKKELKKELAQLKASTARFIDWRKVHSGNPNEMRKAALKLDIRGIPVPDYLQPFLKKDK